MCFECIGIEARSGEFGAQELKPLWEFGEPTMLLRIELAGEHRRN
jgi:hypothetical protein